MLPQETNRCVEPDPIVDDVRVRRRLHGGDGVEDVVDVVAEVEDRVGDDGLGGGDAG